MFVQLVTTTHPGAFLPWLRSVAPRAARQERPTLVLVPTRADAYFLKAQALGAGIALLGVRFVTPPELRKLLSPALEVGANVPPREHLRLLLATAAEQSHPTPETMAVATAPDHLLKAHDLLSIGGWSFAEAGPSALRGVIADYERLVARCGFVFQPAADRALLAAARIRSAALADLFIAGFNGLHWPLWPLLAAAAHTSERAFVCLTEPRQEAEDLDATWIGTWEETFGSSEPLPHDADARPFVDLLRLPEDEKERARRQSAPAARFEFLVGTNTLEQAQAVTAQAIAFLADPACTRLGLLFPAAGALSRRVGELLAARGIAHHDGLAHSAPGPLEDPAWPAWRELQESPRTAVLLRFLQALPKPEKLFAGLPLAEVEDSLRKTLAELLIDDLVVLADWLAEHPHRAHGGKMPAGLRALPLLPEQATLAQFIEATDAIFLRLDWAERRSELHRLSADWHRAGELRLSRRTWLRWLDETLVSTRAERSATGAHPYSRVHLLPCAQAESQAWSHLVVAGLNEGQWPPALDDSGWLGEEEIDGLNRRVRVLNQRVTRPGRQGEGHWIVQPGHTLCLGPAQRRGLVLRQFLNTLESTGVALAVSAQLFDEAAPDRRLNPSDFLTRLYFCARGRVLSQATLSALQAETARWLAASSLWPRRSVEDIAAVAPTRRAYDARRQPGKFGEYEFALRTPPIKPLRLWATAWERALKHPAEVWMRSFLGVEAQAEEADDSTWNLALGQWAHHWLSAISNTRDGSFAPLPAPDPLLARVHDRGVAFRADVSGILQRCDRPLPDWWLSLWHQVMRVAGEFAQHVGDVSGYSHIATEWKLPDTAIRIDASHALHVSGRADVILSRTMPPVGSVPEEPWIIDYKTGSQKAMVPSSRAKTPEERQRSVEKKLRVGDGLQLALYALALQSLGARAFGISRLSPDLALVEPQLTDADLGLGAQPALWLGLCVMQDSGVFGMKGKVRDAYSYQRDYPLATLRIDPDLLEEKWALTHEHLTADEEEGE